MPPDVPHTKKMKVSPFDWFQRAPNGTDIKSASTTLASTKPLNERVLNEIRKYEIEPMLSHIEIDGFVPLDRIH